MFFIYYVSHWKMSNLNLVMNEHSFFVLNYNNEVNLTLNCLYRLFNFFCTKDSVCGYDWAGLTDLGA